jgi:hypothetical protein
LAALPAYLPNTLARRKKGAEISYAARIHSGDALTRRAFFRNVLGVALERLCDSKIGLFMFLAGRIPIRAFAFRADFGVALAGSAWDPLVAATVASVALDGDLGHT